MIEHVCCVCKYRWKTFDKKEERHVIKAVEVNKDGPYCRLCMHLEMAMRYAETRGFKFTVDSFRKWKTMRALRQSPNEKAEAIAERPSSSTPD